MNIFLWIIFGALVGWVASILAGTDAQQGAVANVLVGIVGALIGGFVARRFFGAEGVSGFNLASFLVALAGAIVLIFVVRLIA